MKKAALKTRIQSIYWIILFSLMTGLLFSSGEGIRLLPFPVSSGSDSDNSRSVLGKNPGFYNPSTHHSGGSLLKLKTKNQKNDKLLSGETFRLPVPDFIESSGLRLTEVSGASAVVYKSVHLISLSDRAPPAASS